MYTQSSRDKEVYAVKVSNLWLGIIAIIIGILVLVKPDIIQWSVGIGLIVFGILALLRR